MKIFLFAFAILSTLLWQDLKAQNKQQKWAIGISIAGAKYSPENGLIVGGQLAYQSPRVNISRYLFNNLVLDAAFATAVGDNQKYTTFDGILRYNFRFLGEKLVPYALLGGSFINALRLTPTLNFGAGGTLWIGSNIGINAQGMYKFSEGRFQSQKSHVYASLGLVYRFGSKGGYSSARKGSACF